MKPLFFVVITLGFLNSALATQSNPCFDRVIYSALQEATIPQQSPYIPFKGCRFSALKQSGTVFEVTLQCIKGAGFENPTISFV